MIYRFVVGGAGKLRRQPVAEMLETKEDKVDGMVAMDKTKEVVVVMEEEIVIMAHHLEEEAAEVPCVEVCLFF